MKRALFFCALSSALMMGCSEIDLSENQTTVAQKNANSALSTLDLAIFEPCQGFQLTATGDTDGSAANVTCLQQQIDQAYADGHDGLYVGAYDFYVNMTPGQIYSIKLPSNFTLQLDPACVIRQRPNALLNYSMIFVHQKTNTTILGGSLVGERELHQDTNMAHQFGHLIRIDESTHVLVDGVHLERAFGDGVLIIEPDELHPTEFVEVRNCDFNWIRRNSITVASGHDVEIHHNSFQNTGLQVGTSPGTNPGLAVDVEGTRYWGSNGQLVWTHHPHHVNIHHNTDVGSKLGFEAAVCDYVDIQYNTCTSTLGAAYIYQTGDHVNITNNIVYGNDITAGGVHAGVGNNPGQQTTVVHNNLVADNEIYNCRIGIDFRNDLSKVLRNKIVGAKTGIQCTDIRDCEVSLNTIESDLTDAVGLATLNCPANGFYFRGNSVRLTGATSNGVLFKTVNKGAGQENNKVYFWGNNITCTGEAIFTNITGFDITDNLFLAEGGVKLTNVINDVTFSKNRVQLSASSGQEGIQISKATNVYVVSNDIQMGTTNANRNAIWGSALEWCSVAGNTVHINLPGDLGRAIKILDLRNCKIVDNIGDIGNTKYLVVLSESATNPPFASVNNDWSNNKALTPFYFRQSIFGAVTFSN